MMHRLSSRLGVVTIRDLVLHALLRLERGLYGNPRAQLARHHGVARPRAGTQLNLNPLFLPNVACRVQKRFRRLRSSLPAEGILCP